MPAETDLWERSWENNLANKSWLIKYADDILAFLHAEVGSSEDQQAFLKTLWMQWKQDLEKNAPSQSALKFELSALNSYHTMASRARDAVSRRPLYLAGHRVKFFIQKAKYVLRVHVELDELAIRRIFWQPYASLFPPKAPVRLILKPRLFYRAFSAGDEVFLRSKEVNRTDDGENSALLKELLDVVKSKGSYSIEESRHYVSTGDCNGAFRLLRLFADLEIPAQGDGIHIDEDETAPLRVFLGAPFEPLMGLPAPHYQPRSDGIFVSGEAEPFRDDWAKRHPSIYALVQRWRKGGRITTTIYSNGAAALDGLCEVLTDEDALAAVLKHTHPPTGADALVETTLPTDLEILFKVELSKPQKIYRADRVCLVSKDRKEYPVWSRG